ncbi:MAG: hypothetical protein WBP81_00240 [Solirubrobacteraceae bacterium]
MWALAHPVKYVRVLRRVIRGRERFFCQLILAGRALVKRPARAGERFGIDVGPSIVAVCDEHGNAARHQLACGVSDAARRRLSRRRSCGR